MKEFEKVTGLINLEELEEDSTILNETVGGSSFAQMIANTYTKEMSMFSHICWIIKED